MKVWKNQLITILFALAGVLWLFAAVVKPVIKGKPVNDAFLVFALAFLSLACVFLALGVVKGRKSGGGSGPPSA